MPGAVQSAIRPRRTILIWVALGVVYLIWGSTYLGIRVMTAEMPPFASASLRFATAAVLLATVIAASRGWRSLRVTRRELAGAALVGALLIGGGNGLIVIAESPQFHLPSGIAALLVALSPLVLVVLRATAGDRPRPSSVIGVLVGLAGLALLFLPASGVSAFALSGGLLVLGAVASWSGGSFATRYLPMPANPFVASVYEMLAGAGVGAVAALVRREPPMWAVADISPLAWATLAYMILFGSLLAFTAYVYLLQHAPISLASTYAYVNPVIALFLGAWLVHESLTGRVLVAAGIVVAGVALVVSTERPAPRQP
jgi:drug/metabolite transporter (DMT)-like permease